jgi:hypothetical protein
MSETSLEKYFNSLLPNLYEELLFFIPDKDIPEDILQNIQSSIIRKVFNKLLIMDKYQGPIEYAKGRNAKLSFGKASELEKNTYSLLEKKREIHQIEFKFILDKYFEQIEFLVYITNWMNKNSNQVLEIDDAIRGLFQIQFTYYKKHFHTLLKHFYPNGEHVPQGNFNAVKIIERYYPNISKQHIKTNHWNIPKVDNSVQEEALTKTAAAAKKVKKQPLITEKEAEEVLLKTFFNIEITVGK